MICKRFRDAVAVGPERDEGHDRAVGTKGFAWRSVFVAAALAVTGAEGAAAADLNNGPRVSETFDYSPAATYIWSGAYAGAFVGGTAATWTVDFYRNNNHGHADETATGFAGGGWIGYNYQLSNRWVLGVEADLGRTNANTHNEIFDNDHTDLEYGTFGSVRLRAGYAVDNLLLYATIGYAFATITNNIQKGRNAGEQVVWEDEFASGYALGGGVEYAFSRNWIGRLEYIYSNYGKETLYNADNNRAEFQNELHLLRVGMSYKF